MYNLIYTQPTKTKKKSPKDTAKKPVKTEYKSIQIIAKEIRKVGERIKNRGDNQWINKEGELNPTIATITLNVSNLNILIKR